MLITTTETGKYILTNPPLTDSYCIIIYFIQLRNVPHVMLSNEEHHDEQDN